MLIDNTFTYLHNLFSTLNCPTAPTDEVRVGEGTIFSRARNFAQAQHALYGWIIPIALSVTLLAISCHLISTAEISLHIPTTLIGMGGLGALMLTQTIATWYKGERNRSTLHQTTGILQQGTYSTPSFSALLPLYGYHQKLSIIAPSSLPDFTTHVASLPAELIDMIQAFCVHDDLLALTAVDKAAWATRFCHPRLQKFAFKTVKDTEQFLSHCQALEEKEAQALTLEKEQKIGTEWKPVLSSDTITRFPFLFREHWQGIKALTLTLSAQFTAEQYNLLFASLPGIQHLTIYSEKGNHVALGPLLKAAQHLTLHHAFISPNPNNYGAFEQDHLPDELWQLTPLKILTIRGFENVVSISEDIGQLKALKSLTLSFMYSLNALPVNLEQLNKLEALTLHSLTLITTLPEAVGQLTALKSLELNRLGKLEALPTNLGQLKKLEALSLRALCISTLPKNISQLAALKSLKLNNLWKLEVLPASLGQLNTLEALTLKELNRLTTLPEDIGQLTALKLLKLRCLQALEALPTSLGQLNKLEALVLRELDNITALPKEMGQLRALKSLTLAHMPSLNALPASFVQLDKLEALTLKNLSRLTALPEDIGQLRALKTLSLRCLKELRALPVSLGQLDKLEALVLRELDNITVLPEDIGQLNALKFLKLSALGIEALPVSLGQLGKLEALTLKDLPLITVLPEEVGQLTALKSLALYNLLELKALPASLGQLDKLELLVLLGGSITALPEEISRRRGLQVYGV
jgi:Leucine-rich repeat (LRR) protein